MNYQIINDRALLEDFIDWLPELEEGEVYYLALFARKKYCADASLLKTDKAQCKRFTARKKDLLAKITQLECPLGSYVIKDTVVPQEALALYISVNPRSLLEATRRGLIKFASLITQKYNGYNPHQEIMSEIQKAHGRKLYHDFDFDGVDYGETMAQVRAAVNLDAVTTLKTRGGFHLLIRYDRILPDYLKAWHNKIAALPGVDVRGDNLLPVPGCTQGGFTPHFVLRGGNEEEKNAQ
jgi:hypothetical protein